MTCNKYSSYYLSACSIFFFKVLFCKIKIRLREV